MNKLTRGDKLGKLSAAALNRLPDLIAAHDRGSSSPFDSDPNASARDGIVLVSNKTGAALPAFSVVGLDTAVFSPAASLNTFQQVLAFEAKKPGPDHRGKFAILLEPAPAGATKATPALVVGITAAKLWVVDEAHQWADCESDVTGRLRTADSGAAHILWKESGTGEKWGIIRLGAPSAGAAAFIATATLDGALTGDTGTISGFTVTSPPPFTTAPDPLPTSVANPYKHRGQDGGKVLLLLNAEANEWQVIDVEKTVVKIAVGVGGVGPMRAQDNKLQLYVTEVAAEYATAPAWEDMVPGTGCPAP